MFQTRRRKTIIFLEKNIHFVPNSEIDDLRTFWLSILKVKSGIGRVKDAKLIG